MQREIKFRIWDKNDERMKYADIEYFDDMIGFRFGHRGFEEDDNNDIVIMQYSGLKDKNGKEIYEGDICDGHSDGIGIITWSDFDGGYDYVFQDEANVGIWEVRKEIEVIGNVYENPELCS